MGKMCVVFFFFLSAEQIREIVFYSLLEIRICRVTWKRKETCRDKGFEYLK